MLGNQNISEIIDLIQVQKPLHRKFLNKALNFLETPEIEELSNYIAYLKKSGYTPKQIAEGYITIIEDAFNEQMYFKRVGEYRLTSFSEAQKLVYDNQAFMTNYMLGLAITSFLWSNHVKLRRFFKNYMPILGAKKGLYREVGPGHGLYFIDAIRSCNFSWCEGIDVSSTSVEMTSRLITSGFFGNYSNVSLLKQDFLNFNCDRLSEVLVMGEVLEHVENPDDFIKRAYQTTTDDSLVFITTCINAPAIDHLYNPGTVANLEKLFVDNKFKVLDQYIVPTDGFDVKTCEDERLAINMAYILTK